MKTTLLHSLPVWALFGLLTACGSPRSQPSSEPRPVAPLPIETQTPAAVVEPPPTVPPIPISVPARDALQEAEDKATSARNLAQTAQSATDWELILGRWQQAIALLQKIPAKSPQKQLAQKKLAEYQRELAQARQQAKRPSVPANNRQASQSGAGIPLIIGAGDPDQSSTETLPILQALTQQQLTFFSSNKRFATDLRELNAQAQADSPNFTYMTTGGDRQAIVTATAKTDGLPSYTSTVAMVKDEAGADVQITGVCITTQPARTAPVRPRLDGQQVRCPDGARLLP